MSILSSEECYSSYVLMKRRLWGKKEYLDRERVKRFRDGFLSRVGARRRGATRRDATQGQPRRRRRLIVKSDSVRQARAEGTNRERASVTCTHRPVAGAPKCLISASGASVGVRRRRPIGGPRTSGDSAHRGSPVALFLVTTAGHSPYANVHGASSRPVSAPVAVTAKTTTTTRTAVLGPATLPASAREGSAD